LFFLKLEAFQVVDEVSRDSKKCQGTALAALKGLKIDAGF
jgi:hypothetical protein